MTDRKELLERAIELTCGDRDNEYGDPESNLTNTAKLWSAYVNAKYPLGVIEFVAEDIAWFNVLQKISRTVIGRAGDDTYTDAAAYAAIAGELK